MKKLKQKIKDKLGEKRTASMKKVLSIARVVKNIICWTLIAILTVAIIVFMTTKISGGTPSVFGYSIHRIVSGSMEPELLIGDVIISTKVNTVSDIGVGDIITFQGDGRFDNQKVTHRVLVAPYDDGKGKTVLITKGDANENDDGEISFADVESKFLRKINILRDIYSFFFSPWGLIIFVFLLLLVFFDEIMNIIRLTFRYSEQDDLESFQEILERVKREQLENAMQQPSAESLSQDDSVKQPDGMDSDSINKEKNDAVEKATADEKKEHHNTAEKNKGKEKSESFVKPSKSKTKKNRSQSKNSNLKSPKSSQKSKMQSSKKKSKNKGKKL